MGQAGHFAVESGRAVFEGLGLAISDSGKNALRGVGDASAERTRGVPVKRPARRVRRLTVHVRDFERLGVVERSVAAAVVDGDWMVLRDLVEIANIELATVLHFRVVEEVAFNPGAGRCLRGAGAELFDDAVDGYELDFEGIPHEHFVEQHGAKGVVVRVDEAGNNSCSLSIHSSHARADQVPNVGIRADGEKSPVLDRESLCARMH